MTESKGNDLKGNDREAEATSSETLSDLEQGQEVADSHSTEESQGSEIPSPDGTADGNREHVDDAGPM